MWRARLSLAGMLDTGVLRGQISSLCYKWRRVQSADFSAVKPAGGEI
jgi:hypothetical protein